MYWSNKAGEVFVWHLPWSRVTNSGLTRLEEKFMARRYSRRINKRPSKEDFHRARQILAERSEKEHRENPWLRENETLAQGLRRLEKKAGED